MLKQRWFSLRGTLLTAIALKQRLSGNIDLLKNDGAYQRESIKWSTASPTNALALMTPWIDNRLQFLDVHFGGFDGACATPPAPLVSVSSASVTAGQSLTLKASGCPYTVVWNTGQTGAAIQINPWRTTTFTAICQEFSAGCLSAPSIPVSVVVVAGPEPASRADLSLTMQADARIVSPNQPVAVTLEVANSGPDVARGIQLQNRLPAGLSFVGSSSGQVLSHTNGIINMRIDSLAVNAAASIRYTVNVTGTGVGTFQNTTQILSSATFDPDSPEAARATGRTI